MRSVFGGDVPFQKLHEVAMTIMAKALVLCVAMLWPASGFAGAVRELPDPPEYLKAVSLKEAEPAGPPQHQETVTLKEVVARVLLQNPELKVYSLEQRAREAGALQAGQRPNPRLAVEVENAAGSGAYSGFGRSETTVRLSQLVELGGKRAARMQAGALASELAGRDYEIKRIDVLIEAAKAFIDLLKAERQVDLSLELLTLAEKSLNAVKERVRAGKVPAIETAKAEVELAAAKLGVERSRGKRLTARRNLAVTWGETEPKAERAKGDLEKIAPVPSLDLLVMKIDQSPELRRWATELDRRQAVVEMERARATPDISLEAGYRRIEESDDNALVFGLSIPLPLFDRNQGSLAEARHRLAKAEAEESALAIHLRHRLAKAHQALALAHAEVLSLRAEVVPGAESAYAAMTEGYRFGKFGFLEMLDSQRTLFQARIQTLDALARYHKAVADVERLVGTMEGAAPTGAGKEERSHEN